MCVPFTVPDVRSVLLSLGDTPEAVSESLRALGRRGVPGDGAACPLADHLRRTFGLPAPEAGQGDGASVGDAEVMVWSPRLWTWVVAPTPPACAQFVIRFDNGEFADLCH